MTEHPHDPAAPDRGADELDPGLEARFAALDAVEPPDTWPGDGRSRPVASPRRWLVAAAVVALLAGPIGWAWARDDDTDVTAGEDSGPPDDGASDDSGSDDDVASAPVVGECPVTVPAEPGFTPPEPWPAEASLEDAVWFGSDELWTVIKVAGHSPRKSVWWSAEFPGGGVEPEPEIAVVYERLDGPSDIVDLGPTGTNAFAVADGWYMIAGGEPTTPGCWRATATYKGATLSYVYEVPPSAGCPDPELAAAAMMAAVGVTFDYQPSASPAEAAASVDHVVVGRVTDVGVESGGEVWLELSDLEPSSALGAGPIRVEFIDFVGAEPDPADVVGVRALVMLHEFDGAIGGLSIDLEGLWFSCDDDGTAFPAKLAPITDGWPDEPTIAELLDLIETGSADLDGGVDGPVMFSAPLAEVEAAEVVGTIEMADGCVYLRSGAERVAVLWPAGTSWQVDPPGVVIPSGELVVVGDTLRGGGGYHAADDIGWAVQDPDALAMADRCAAGAGLSVVVMGRAIELLEASDPSQSDVDAERDGVDPEVAALSFSERVDVLAEVVNGEGRWVLSLIPTGPNAPESASEYGEILLLDDDSGIVRAYPMPSAIPSWILVTGDEILAGRIGDGGLPDSTFVRIDRATLEADVLLIPAPFDGGTSWPESWRVATPEEVELYDRAVGFAPDGATGAPAESWIGEVVVDLDLLGALAQSAFG